MKNPKQLCVLYAEDNEDACLMVTVALEFEDIKVTGAKTVAEAWWWAQTEYFDLYLLDSRFPDGDGLDLCRQLHEYAPHTPIIIYSGNAYKTDKQEGFAAGASDYITKPFMGNLSEKILSAIKFSELSAIKFSQIDENNYSEDTFVEPFVELKEEHSPTVNKILSFSSKVRDFITSNGKYN